MNSTQKDYITSQSASSSSASGWRVWKSGLIEQWGFQSGNATVTFPKAFKNTNYNIVACAASRGAEKWATGGFGLHSCTATNFYFMSQGDNGGTYTAIGCWHAWGF